MKRFAITVTGQVQGVSYRKGAREQAIRLGLAGFARNEPDGTVYVEVEGPEPQLQEFLAWCQTGSPSAIVESVTYQEHLPGGHVGFDRL